MTHLDDGGPIFPGAGITVRDVYAMVVAHALAPQFKSLPQSAPKLAEDSYAVADEMMRWRIAPKAEAPASLGAVRTRVF